VESIQIIKQGAQEMTKAENQGLQGLSIRSIKLLESLL